MNTQLTTEIAVTKNELSNAQQIQKELKAELERLTESLTMVQQERLGYKTKAEQATAQFDKLVG